MRRPDPALPQVYIGFPFSHDPFSPAPVKWRVLNVRVDKYAWEKVSHVLNLFATNMRSMANSYRTAGKMPHNFARR